MHHDDTQIGEGAWNVGIFGRLISLTATIRYATSTQDGIGLAAWPILMSFFVAFVVVHVLLIWVGLVLLGVE